MSELAHEPIENRIQKVAADSISPSCKRDLVQSSLGSKKYWLIDGVVVVKEVYKKASFWEKLSEKNWLLKALFITPLTFLGLFCLAVYFNNIKILLLGLAAFGAGQLLLKILPVQIPKYPKLPHEIAQLRLLGYEKGFSAISQEALGLNPELPCNAFHPEELRYLYANYLITLKAQCFLAGSNKAEIAFSVFQENLFGRALLASLGFIQSPFACDLSTLIEPFENRRQELYQTYDKRHLEAISDLNKVYEARMASVIYWKTVIHYNSGTFYTTRERDYLRERIEKKRLSLERDAKIEREKKQWVSHYAFFFDEAKAFLEKASPLAERYLEGLIQAAEQKNRQNRALVL